LMPGVVASTAKARMAPSTIRKMPTPMLIFTVLHGADGTLAWRAYATLDNPKPVVGVTNEPCVVAGGAPLASVPHTSFASIR
jgi:hypothetical protein